MKKAFNTLIWNTLYANSPIYSPRENEETDVLTEGERNLVVYNDDVNTFDHVIDCLQRICNHTAEQAEQSSLLIHYKGKCIVKSGEFDTLRIMCEALLEEGLSAEIH